MLPAAHRYRLAANRRHHQRVPPRHQQCVWCIPNTGHPYRARLCSGGVWTWGQMVGVWHLCLWLRQGMQRQEPL